MSAATLANLVAQMNQDQEVLQGWDAVLNLLESSVNSFFQTQWSQLTGNSGRMAITTVWCEGVETFHGTTFTNVTQFEVVLGPPLFQFLSGQSNVTVTQDILSGSLKTGTKPVPSTFNPADCGCSPNDPSVDWGTPQTVDTSASPTLTGTVALGQVLGLIDANTNSLVLDFAKGTFVLNQLTVTGVSSTTIADQLRGWFATNNIRYIIASLNLQNVSGQPALTPSSFQFNVATTNSGNTVVQLMITTDGSAPRNATINVEEPIPTADGLTCSLMVSSRIAFQAVLAGGFNQSSVPFHLVAVPPQSGDAWYATISPPLEFSGQFTFGSCCDQTTVSYIINLGWNYTGSASSGFVLSQWVTTQGNASISISVSASYPVSLSGSGPEQVMTIVPGTPSVSVSGSVESEITSQLQNILNNDLQNAMKAVSFSSVTLFALTNLIFPGNLIHMSQVQVPADLLIVGTFSPQGG